MFDHIEFSVSHLGKARQFYRPICEAIGCEEAGEHGFEARGGTILDHARRTDPVQVSPVFQSL